MDISSACADDTATGRPRHVVKQAKSPIGSVTDIGLQSDLR